MTNPKSNKESNKTLSRTAADKRAAMARALRDNLKKRKQQQRARKAG